MADAGRDDNLDLVLATWVFLLHVSGVAPSDAELAAACKAISDATEATSGDKAGDALIKKVRALVGDSHSPEHVAEIARKLYGDRARTDLGAGSREERTTRIRKYQFGKNLPWIARIHEKRNGSVGPSWLLVEQVTDNVMAMDPNPWNDVDEERTIPVGDFHVLWELDDCASVSIA
jgi:hypothetical protein